MTINDQTTSVVYPTMSTAAAKRESLRMLLLMSQVSSDATIWTDLKPLATSVSLSVCARHTRHCWHWHKHSRVARNVCVCLSATEVNDGHAIFLCIMRKAVTTAVNGTRKPCCRRESARCRCNFRSIDQEHDK